jgi:hypothetical protein
MVHDKLTDSRVVDVFGKGLFVGEELELVLGEGVGGDGGEVFGGLVEEFVAFEGAVEEHVWDWRDV